MHVLHTYVENTRYIVIPGLLYRPWEPGADWRWRWHCLWSLALPWHVGENETKFALIMQQFSGLSV